MTATYTLYGRRGSGSFAVQVALEEIGARYERVWVGQEPADVARYRKLNPTARVPALALPDGTVVFESAAMLIHLAQAHPASRLAPQAGTIQSAQFLQWMVFLSANVYEAALRTYYSDRYSIRGEADADAIRQRATAEFVANLGLISERLDPFVLQSEYSIADVYLYMLAAWCPGEKAELHARLPKLAAHAALMAARPAVIKVEADHAG